MSTITTLSDAELDAVTGGTCRPARPARNTNNNEQIGLVNQNNNQNGNNNASASGRGSSATGGGGVNTISVEL